MPVATGWKWTTGLLHLVVHFTMVNRRLFTTRIWEKFEVFLGRNDPVKMISGTADLSYNDPQGLLWNSGTKYWKQAQSDLVIGLFSFQRRLILVVY
jgi:hypothetical protein